MKKVVKLFSCLVLCSIFLQSVMACGPFTVEPLFSFTRHADYPLGEYTKGKTGNVPSSYGRISLFVFYRHLNNLPFTAKEQADIDTAIANRIGTHIPDGEEPESSPESANKDSAVERWKAARTKVFANDAKLSVEKRLPDDYFYYSNCLDDAFETATKILENRIKDYGINAPVQEWLNGQDAVFANCSGETNKMPTKLSETDADWLQKDRAYQTAAALFYQNKFADARTEFQKISRDNNSVWKNTAKFVVARTYIREASFIDESEPDYDPQSNANWANATTNVPRKEIKSINQKKSDKVELLQKAETELNTILTDASMKDFHASAKRLSGLVGFRAKPREQRRKLAETLVQKGENPNIYNDLVDYIWLLDKVDSEASEAGREREANEAQKAGKEYNYDYNLKRQDISNAELGADLTDWLFTYQAEDGFAHAYAKWKEKKSLAWLVSAISHAKSNSANLEEILSEVDRIKADSPGFATVRYHHIRLLIESGKRQEAKQKLNEILPELKNYARSTQNDFLSQRMILSENLDEFLKYAQRQAATFVWSDDANEEGDDLKDNKVLGIWKNRPMFDWDSVIALNEKMPLSVLRQAALNPTLPNHLKKFLVIAVWTRSFVLGNQTIQNEFTPLMTKFAPEYKIPVNATEAASLVAIGRNPAIQMYVPVGYGRDDADPTSIDSIRGNWWCVQNNEQAVSPSFLTAAQQAEAAAEQKKLNDLGESATFLARRAVEFANKNMTNPSTPEILHLAVRSTRYGCRDTQTLKFSKAAFDILHKRLPRSEWTKKTPYYFGEREN